MYRENFDFLYAMFPHHEIEGLNIIIVNQTDKNKQLSSTIPSVTVINSFERGLSKSRNLALKNATSDWCLIADDDLIYSDNFEDKLEEGAFAYNSSGVIIFQAQVNKSMPMRVYPLTSKEKLRMNDIFHVASFEMLINRKKLYNKVWFNKYFGLGSDVFLHGEEQVFLKDVMKKGYKISFVNKTIVQHPLESTGRNNNLKNRYYIKGGIYAKMFPKFYIKWVFLQLMFDVKQKRLPLSKVYKSIKASLEGVNRLKQIEHARFKS